MITRPNAFADERRIRAVAETLGITADEVNLAFGAYIPRDVVEAGMVERVLLLEHQLRRACQDADDPSLTPVQAGRLRRAVCELTRQLERTSIRLEQRQAQWGGHLPQQYWRPVAVQDVGPYDSGQPPVTGQPVEQPISEPPAAPAQDPPMLDPVLDDPDLAERDPLYRLLRGPLTLATEAALERQWDPSPPVARPPPGKLANQMAA
jgi:hypothetical protein